MRAAALALASGVVIAASAPPAWSHCFSVWKYKTPQHCGGIYARAAQSKDKNWYVEIVTPPPVEKDERTPEEIADQAEHDAAVKAKHDEINMQMLLIKAKEAEGLDPNE